MTKVRIISKSWKAVGALEIKVNDALEEIQRAGNTVKDIKICETPETGEYDPVSTVLIIYDTD